MALQDKQNKKKNKIIGPSSCLSPSQTITGLWTTSGSTHLDSSTWSKPFFCFFERIKGTSALFRGLWVRRDRLGSDFPVCSRKPECGL